MCVKWAILKMHENWLTPAPHLWNPCICWARREGGGNEWIEYVSTNSTEKHDFEECGSILTTTTYNLQKMAFLNCRGTVGRLENGFSAIHTDTNISILDDNICGMTHFSEWQSILTNIGI